MKLNNTFLAVDKGLFKLGLNPTQILLMAQMMEYQRNTGSFFMSDETLATEFGVSKSTISREIKSLETKGFIKKETKNTQKGKERHITVDLTKIPKQKSADFANVNLNVADSGVHTSANVNLNVAQESNCLLRNEQNDFIKENIKRKKLKDNQSEEMDKSISSQKEIPAKAEISLNPEEEVKEELGSHKNPIIVKREWIIERYNEVSTCANGLFFYHNQFYRMEK